MTESSATPPDPRMAALERRLRRLHAVLVTLFVLVLTMLTYQFAPRPPVVEAREFVLRDRAGRNRAALTLLEGRFPTLRLNNENGRARAILFVRDDESAVFRLSDREGQHRVQIWTQPDGTPALGLADAGGHPLVRMGLENAGGGSLSIRDTARIERIVLP
jgi:hypothetical protein